MKTFQTYTAAKKVSDLLEEPQASFDLDVLKKLLIKNGYTEIKDISSKRIVIVTDKNRVDALTDIANFVPGAKYDSEVKGSSVGGVILPSKITILAKPKSGGSGAGAEVTKLVESAQCLYCAARWYANGKYDSDSLKKASKYIDTDESLDNMINKLPDDWVGSCIATAETLYKEFGNKRYTFHRGSSWIDNLEKLFKKLNLIEKEFSNLNKWSPADIYMVAVSEKFDGVNSIKELNARLLNHIRKKTVVGVSLKKTKDAKLKYQNLSKDKSTYEIKNPYYTLGKKGFFSSKDIYLYYHEGSVQFRTFSAASAWQGEIKGKYANHGKVGGGVVGNIVKKISNSTLEDAGQIKKLAQKKDVNFYKNFYKYYSSLEKSPLPYDKFVGSIEKAGLDWIVSKYLGTKLIYHIGENKIEQMIGNMISYASSNSEMSAPFVKVS
jgi:hypothetical protein